MLQCITPMVVPEQSIYLIELVGYEADSLTLVDRLSMGDDVNARMLHRTKIMTLKNEAIDTDFLVGRLFPLHFIPYHFIIYS